MLLLGRRRLVFTVEMDLVMSKLLDQMASDCGINRVELFRRSIALLKIALEEKKLGNRIMVVDSAGTIKKEIVL